MGLVRVSDPADPTNFASPKEKSPPSEATIQYPCPITRKHPVQVTEPPSLTLVTVTSRAPGGASAPTARLASSRLSDTTAVGPSVTPVPEMVIRALGRKLMPSIPRTSPEVSCHGADGPLQVALSWSPWPTMLTGFLASSQTQARFVPSSLCAAVLMGQVASPGLVKQVRSLSSVLR